VRTQRGLKALAIKITDRLLRGYIRYSPIQTGKRRAWRLYDERFSWRCASRIATTPFGFKIHAHLPNQVPKHIWLTGRWEPVITEFFRGSLAPGDTFVDVGANIGYYSLLASRIVGPHGHVYAIEASPTIFGLLRANVALNQASNVQIVHAIAADGDGEKEFWLAPAVNLGQSTSVETLGRSKGMRSEGRVRSRALTSLVPTDRLLNARIIKIDVEGAERAVLEPIFARLPEFSSRTVWTLELSPELCPGAQADVDCVFNAFSRHGYTAFAIRNDYSLAACLSRPRSVEMKRIEVAPSTQADVVFVRE